MATYYIDFDNGNDTNDGSATDSAHAWATLDKFTENSRNSGDIAIVRGGMSQASETNLTFTSDGDSGNPITIKRDYGDEWSDHVDVSGTATATFTFGSKTVTFTADVSSVISAGDIIYNNEDDNEEFCYEVASVSTNTVVLQLPFKGTSGSGKTVINMGTNPVWGSTSSANYIYLQYANFWKLIGLHIISNTKSVAVYQAAPHEIINCILETNGSGDYSIQLIPSYSGVSLYLKKTRLYNSVYGIYGFSSQQGYGHIKFIDCLIDNNSISLSSGMYFASYPAYVIKLIDVEFKNSTNGIYINYTSFIRIKGRNVLFTSVTNPIDCIYYDTITDKIDISIEDFNNVKNDSRIYSFDTNGEVVIMQSEETEVRSGGSSKSIKINPNNRINSNNINRILKIFELPIYATTTSKTYTIYIKPDDITEWTTSPTASELWLELETWGHATNNFRKITKSTGTIDMTSDTWQALTVTVAPAQEGVAYLRLMYTKIVEWPKDNIFYVDPIPVIS